MRTAFCEWTKTEPCWASHQKGNKKCDMVTGNTAIKDKEVDIVGKRETHLHERQKMGKMRLFVATLRMAKVDGENGLSI